MNYYKCHVRFFTEESFEFQISFDMEVSSEDDIFERFKEEVSSLCSLKPVHFEYVSIGPVHDCCF